VTFAGGEESFVFIRRNIPGTVYSEPKLSTSKVPHDVMLEWESKTLTITDWSNEFQAIDGTSEVFTSAEEIQTETEFLVESSLLRTPGKRKKDSFGGEEFEGPRPSWKNQKYDRSLPSDPIDLNILINEGVKKGVITATVAKIESFIQDMADAVAEATSIHHERLFTLEDTCEVMIGMIQTMKARIGSSVDLGERFTAPTLWGATAFIADDLTKMAHDFSVLQSESVKPLQSSVDALKDADAEINSKTEKVVRAVKLLLSRVQAINESIQEVKTDLVLVRTERSVRFTEPGSTPSNPSDDLMEFILSEEESFRSPDRPRRSENAYGIVSPPKPSGEDEGSDDNVRSILSKLIEDVKTLQGAKQNTAIKFAGLGISDLSDCTAWINEHFKGYQYGLIMDPLLMLDRVYGDDEVAEGGGALLKAMELQYKMKIESGGEAAALNALRYSRPRVFHKGRPTIVSVQNKSRLNLLPSHSDWNPGGEGVMEFCVNKMNLLEDMISDEIGHTFRIESTAHWIASKCLSATVSFLTQLFGCVESIYKRLFNFSKFTSEQAWSLTTQVLDRILADLFMPKDNLIQSLKTRNTPSTCAQVLLAAFKTHDIMSVYVAHKFENHPSVSTEYVKFLATNSGSEKVVKLSESLDVVKSKVNAASEEAKAATKKADIAGSKYADLAKELASLTQKVKSLEAKAR
jgi:hypothetical protein